MFHSCVAAALRNVMRNKLYAGINIVGVTLGFVAVLLIALFVRDELTFDRFIPGYENVYRLAKTLRPPGAVMNSDGSSPAEAAWFRHDIPEISAIARLWPDDRGIRVADREANETVVWTDPEFFAVFPVAAIYGSLEGALSRANTAVLTRSMALKYFGRPDVVGESIEIDRKAPLLITAVIETWPSASHLNVDILASAASSASPFAAKYPERIGLGPVYTYLRLTPGSLNSVKAQVPALVERHVAPDGLVNMKASDALTYTLQPLSAIHMLASNESRTGTLTPLIRPSGDMAAVTGLETTAGMILLIAVANFVSLMTARAGRRAVEVGIRKTSGAERLHLIAQFMGESIAYVCASFAVAVIIVVVSLPAYSAFVGRDVPLHIGDPSLLTAALALLSLVATLGGLYPAVLLSSFRPALILKTAMSAHRGGEALRKILVVGQFAMLIAMMVATTVTARQTTFAMAQGFRTDTDQLLIVTAQCRDAFRERVAALPGVKGAACARSGILGGPVEVALTPMPDGSFANMENVGVEAGLLELYGLKPIAGRFFEPGPAPGPQTRRQVVVNETVLRKLHFPSAEAAIGRPTVPYDGDARTGSVQVPAHMLAPDNEIIGVVPDFPMRSAREAPAMTLFARTNRFDNLIVKLDRDRMGGTIQAIDRLWDELGTGRPIQRQFFSQHVQDQYTSLIRQTKAFAAFVIASVFVAMLGLFGLCVFTAERRTKEIGIRKAMGASRGDITRLLLWEFIRPVVWATAIAWPFSYFAMRRWLNGFAYRTDIDFSIFAGASMLAAAIAALTIIAQIFRVARAEPVAALRYE